MKLIAFFTLVCTLQLSANAFSQEVRIDLDMQKVKASKVIDFLKSKTDLIFFYNQEIDEDKIVSIKSDNLTIQEVLDEITSQMGCSYKIIENYVILRKGNKDDDIQEERIIEGKVTDSEGIPLAGATVLENGTMNGVTTDNEGKFTLNVKGVSSKIKVSFIGFTSQIIEVGNKTEFNIVLEESTTSLDEVIITGYQAISKERSAGSFVKIQNNSIQEKSASMNVIDRLEGLIPGLTVNHGEGSDKFVVRGISSINASRLPLYVLDGVPIEYEDLSRLLNPYDVESVVVLKDATATSIWGAQAANGVIVITTKKGKASGKIKLDYSGFVSFKGRPDYSYQNLMTPKQFIETARDIFDPVAYPFDIVSNLDAQAHIPVVLPHEQVLYDEYNGIITPEIANQRLDSLASLNNRSQIEKYFMQPAMLTSHSLSANGGNEFHNYYGSISYTNDQAVDKSYSERFLINLRQNFTFSPSVKLDITLNLSQEKSKNFIVSDLPTLNSYLPYAMFSDANGNSLSQSYLIMYSEFRENAENLSGISLDFNPLDEWSYADVNNNKTVSARINTGLTVNIFKGLKYEGRFQYQSVTNNNYRFEDQDSYGVRKELVHFTQAGPPPTYYLPSQGGHYYSGNSQSSFWEVRNQLAYEGDWDDKKHQLTVLGGTQVNRRISKSNTSFIRGYDFQTLTYDIYDQKELSTTGINNPVIPNSFSRSRLSGLNPFTATEVEIRFVSFYGNLAYSLNKKYNLNASVRMDQSNLFGSDISQQYKPVWSVGGSWKVSDEAFFKSNTINNLKLRLTYGIGGNSPEPGSGGPYNILSASTHPWYSNLGRAYTIIQPANDNLVWEKTTTTNLGIDATLFKNKLFITLDLYNKNTTDLLGYQAFDPTNGWFRGYTNLGNINNKGIELSLRYQIINENDFKWNANFTFAYNHNKVVSLGNVLPLTPTQKLISNGFVEGYSAYSLFTLKWAGLDESGNPQVYNHEGEIINKAEDLKLEDIIHVGTTQPVYTGGLNNTFTYKNWELSCLIVYNLGHKMRNDVNMFYSGRLTSNLPVYFLDRWQNPGDENTTDVPAYISDGNLSQNLRYTQFYRLADINVINAGYIKLRDLMLTYNVPESITRQMGVNKLRIYAQVNNILLWTANDEGIDPEYYNLSYGNTLGNGGATSAGGGIVGGSNIGNRPDKMPPFWTFGVNISF